MAPSLDFACVRARKVPQRPEVMVSLGGDKRLKFFLFFRDLI